MLAVIGNTVIDLFLHNIADLPRASGDEFTGGNLIWCQEPVAASMGGNGANVAYVFAALGGRVTLFSALGVDWAGGLLQEWLAREKVSLKGIYQDKSIPTSTNVVLTDQANNRLSFFYAGADASLDYSKIDLELLLGHQFLLICGYPLLPALRGETAGRILALARARGLKTAMDIGPAIGQPVLLTEIKGFFPDIDYLLGNFTEINTLTGEQEMEDSLACLEANGYQGWVVAKQGEKGVNLYQIGKRLELYVPAYQVPVRGTVGAGDTFDAAFLWGLQQGFDEKTAARWGNAAASLVVATGGLVRAPSREEIEKVINYR
ncbi:carbohydrate kinase family protein [Moorella naiadis]|uniref:carbohydrate kinase family protein n=1 Tax=Moorella naiadis (nom. illeg.) TaxID=3093670 RepID=UPI003D9C983A